MKTATVTFHAADNCGAFLQAYALQQVLKKELHVENSIIDFRSPELTKMYSVIRPVNSPRELVHDLISLMHYRKHTLRHKRYEEIRRNHLDLTDGCSTEEEAVRCAEKFDLLIAGSDQIWNSNLLDFSPVYFLRNMTAKKVAYSASMGSRPNADSVKEYWNDIKDFSHISVREGSAQRVVQELLGEEVEITLDPTQLLPEEAYRDLYSTTPLIKGKYVFFYSILTGKETIEITKRIAAYYKLPVVTVFTNSRAIICELNGIRVCYDAGPGEFLNLMKHAEVVATNSFHGMIFSVIFHKNFYFVCNRKHDVGSGDARIDDFLLPLGIDNRFVYADTDLDAVSAPICWERVDQNLEKKRRASIDYLKKAVQ